MNARDNLLTTLVVSECGNELRIGDLLADDDPDHFETVLAQGESFGGRHYGEWLAIARGSGRVDAEWLRV